MIRGIMRNTCTAKLFALVSRTMKGTTRIFFFGATKLNLFSRVDQEGEKMN